MSMRPRSSTWAWGAFADAMRYAKGSCDSWAAQRLFAATGASFARWLCRGPMAHVSIVTAGRSITVQGAGDQVAPQLVGRNLFRSAVPESHAGPLVCAGPGARADDPAVGVGAGRRGHRVMDRRGFPTGMGSASSPRRCPIDAQRPEKLSESACSRDVNDDKAANLDAFRQGSGHWGTLRGRTSSSSADQPRA
jgi:hypothetical protein